MRLAAAGLLLALLLVASLSQALPGLPQTTRVPATGTAPPGDAPGRTAWPTSGVGYAPGGLPPITFTCPQVDAQAATQVDPTDRVMYGCPYRIYDGTYSFGNARIAVNPEDHREVAFAALHDQPARGGPHEYSRSGQTHTVFTSDTQGIVWEDQPIMGAPNGGFGETADIVMDQDGNLYVAYLWSRATGNATNHGGTVGLYKAEPTTNAQSVRSAYGSGFYVQDRSGANPVTNLGLAFVPPRTPPPPPPPNATHEQPPASEGEYGEDAIPSNDSRMQRVVAVWHERAADFEADNLPFPAWIDAAVTDTSGNNSWRRLPDGLGRDGQPDANETLELIGPCMDSSNPVAFEGLVYVACVADRGYDAGGRRSRADIGDIDVWSINPLTRTTHWVADTGLNGGHPLLAVSPDGYMVLVTTRFDGDRRATRVEMATGWYGKQWNALSGDLGPELQRLAGSTRPVLDGRVTAIAVSEQEKTAVLIYKEWQEPQEGDPPTVPDPADPTDSMARQITDYNKVLLTFNACDGPIAAARLQLGTAVDATNVQAYLTNPGVFNDIQDGLVWAREPTGAEVFYMAANDYGAMQYAGILVGAHSSACFVTPPVMSPPFVPVPQALGVATQANLMVAAGAGVAAVAMVAYLLTVKRKLPVFTTAEDK